MLTLVFNLNSQFAELANTKYRVDNVPNVDELKMIKERLDV